MVHDNRYEGGWFNRDSDYSFTIDAFNENGVSAGGKIFVPLDAELRK
jgi:hypothetical protein